jgi:hypothetical protein
MSEPTAEEIAPLRLLDGEGSYSLMLTEFDAWAETFEEAGYEGGGYGWHGVADALIRLKAPKLKKKVRFDPEASMFVAHGPDRDALVELAKLMKGAMTDPTVLQEALADVKPGLMG